MSFLVLADEHISDEDLEPLKDNHESFMHMSSPWEVCMRLYRRKAISDQVKEGFDRRYTAHGPVTSSGKKAATVVIF